MLRISNAAAVTLFLGFAVPRLVAQGDPAGPVDVAILAPSNWDRLAPGGKEVDAIFGDIVLRNEHLVAVIAQPLPTRHANMTVKDVGGSLIDLTARAAQSDQLSAYYPGKRQYPYRAWSVVLNDAEQLDPAAELQASGRSAAVTVKADGGDKRPAVEVTYRLDAGAKSLEVTTKYTNTQAAPLDVELVDDLRADGGKEDMAKAANGAADLFWFDDRFWQQAYGFEAEGRRIQSNSDARTSTLKYVDAAENATVTLAPGESVAVVRRIAPGRNLLDVRAAFAERKARKHTPVTLAVRDKAGRPVPQARIDIVQADRLLGTVTGNERGDVTIPLRPGNHTVDVSALGLDVLMDYPVQVLDAEQQSESILLPAYQPGRVIARITDEQGVPLPCKVSFTTTGDAPQPDFGPESAEFGVKNLRYAPLGEVEQDLPPGRYDVVISHGPEYDAVVTQVTVEPGQRTRLRHQLVRSVDTAGWISGDFHSHSTPSGDNTSSQLGRVLNHVCEHLEFVPCTEHNRISTYVPHINRLRIGKFLATCSGMELTGSPLPLNHQNAFPLHEHPHRQDGGGPQTGDNPDTQVERLALWDDRSEKLIQQDHPDIGWLFFDRDGNGEPDSGFANAVGFLDVMEIHPITQALDLQPVSRRGTTEWNNHVFCWLQLLNQGYRIPGVTNTDAHYNFHGTGWLRVWVASPTDDPAEINTLEVVHAAEAGRIMMSNGPFLEVTAREAGTDRSAGIGQDLAAPSGKVQLHVRVQCANWLDVDQVFVLVNGRRHATHDYSREKNADLFADGVVKFDRTLDLDLPADAHVVVVTGHTSRTLQPVYEGYDGEQQPVALSNPIFIDVDGGGFQPNRDTLGHPLPVKYSK
jgi:hypothetical protein